MTNEIMKVYDNYEISPCRRFDDSGLPDPNGLYYEVCEPDEADVWTLYGHIHGEGAEAIGDFSTREHAEETFSRISGIPFTGAQEVAARFRVMHAGPKLLAALMALAEQADEDCPAKHRSRHFREALEEALTMIAEATGRAA